MLKELAIMKDYQELFYFKHQQEKLEETINNIGAIKGKLAFYENEFSTETLDKAFQELYKLHKELEKAIEEEKQKFSKEELKELHYKYNEYIRG